MQLMKLPENEKKIGIALDEFQEIHNFGGETAEWDLRGTIQRDGNISYLLAGSREHLIHRMILNKGALYKLVDKMPFGPMDAEYLSNWIDSWKLALSNIISTFYGRRYRER